MARVAREEAIKRATADGAAKASGSTAEIPAPHAGAEPQGWAAEPGNASAPETGKEEGKEEEDHDAVLSLEPAHTHLSDAA